MSSLMKIGRKNMKKNNGLDKKDWLLMGLLAVFFLVFVLLVTRFTYAYGSTMDWESQHSVLPDYFRTLFYKTHDLFPDFAFNLGNGQNIYNFVYYGLLSPFILISYMLPFIEMADYVALASIVSVVASASIFYVWLRRAKAMSRSVSFLGAFVLLFATSLSFHSHRHVMFIDYMPFMVLGLFGVDKKLESGKGWLLSLCIFGMIMTSFYYSVGGIITLVLYGIYKWIGMNKSLSVKKFFADGCAFAVPILSGVLMGSVVLLPTFHVILSSRGATFNTITWKDLFLPGMHIDYMLYDTYGVGLTAVLIPSIINAILKKREKSLLGILLGAMMIFPFINYLLNATMYIDAKALIPVLPLAAYVIAMFLEDIFAGTADFKKVLLGSSLVTLAVLASNGLRWAFFGDIAIVISFLLLYKKFDKRFLIILPVVSIPFAISLGCSYGDEYVKGRERKEVREELREVIGSITDEEKGLYRISNAKTILRDVNNIFGNIDYYTSTLYSSTYNMGYNKFYYDIIENPIQNRNRVITSPTANILFLMFSSNKYLINNRANYFGYEFWQEVNGDKIYKNDDVFPIIYARDEVLSEKDFDEFSSVDKEIALLKAVIVDDKGNYEYSSPLAKVDFDEQDVRLENLTVDKDDGDYIFDADEKSKAFYTIPEEYRGKILFIRFKMKNSASCSSGDTSITIDGVKNKLTCRSWKYHNQNYDFAYTLPNENRSELKITFEKGAFRLSDIEIYALDYEEIKNERDNLDEFNFDKSKTRGDYIVGDIDVSEDGYIVTSIPYDKGFIIEVDGQKVDYTRVNKAFVGFKTKKGHHEIIIEYKAPLKKEGLILSTSAFVAFGIMTFLERKKTTN